MFFNLIRSSVIARTSSSSWWIGWLSKGISPGPLETRSSLTKPFIRKDARLIMSTYIFCSLSRAVDVNISIDRLILVRGLRTSWASADEKKILGFSCFIPCIKALKRCLDGLKIRSLGAFRVMVCAFIFGGFSLFEIKRLSISRYDLLIRLIQTLTC